MDNNDPRMVYEMSEEQAYRAWPCLVCRTRRDEHRDQNLPGPFPELDITDHDFIEARDAA